MRSVVAIGCMWLCVACARRGGEGLDAESAMDADQEDGATIVVEAPSLGWIEADADAEPVPRDCGAAVEETCNALDDNCDGVIDEGCGYGGGLMQITASWDTGSDIDLYVTGPSGELLSFQRPLSPGGGRVDHSGRGDCDPTMPNPRLENIRWLHDRPTPGVYEVQLHYWGECVSGGGPTTATVSVAIDREIAGQYVYTLLPGERKVIARFQIE